MSDHDTIATIDVSTDEGTVATMNEIECGGRYTMVDDIATYCPLCGDEL